MANFNLVGASEPYRVVEMHNKVYFMTGAEVWVATWKPLPWYIRAWRWLRGKL